MVEQTLNSAFKNLDTIFPGVEIVANEKFLYKISNPFLKFFFLKFYDKQNIPPDRISFDFESDDKLLIYPQLDRKQEIKNNEPLYIVSLNYNTDVAESSQIIEINSIKKDLRERLGINANSILLHDHSIDGPNIQETMIQTLLPLTLSQQGFFTLHEDLYSLKGVFPDIIAFKDVELSNLLQKHGIPHPLPLCFYSNLEWSAFINKPLLKPNDETHLSVIEVKDTKHYLAYKRQLHKYCMSRYFHKAYGCSALIDPLNDELLEEIKRYDDTDSIYGYMYFDKDGFQLSEDPLFERGKISSRTKKGKIGENRTEMIPTLRNIVVMLLLSNLSIEQITDNFSSDNLNEIINSRDSLENIAKILEILR